MTTNEHGQPIGPALPGWRPRPLPPKTSMVGAHVVVEPLEPDRHAEGLFEAYRTASDAMWTYMPYGPFDRSSLQTQLEQWAACDDPMFHVIADAASGRPLGLASYLRLAPTHGVIEVGNISYSPGLARTTGATEAMWLMMRRAFDELGYRRYEWKCDALNGPSRAAAERLGFVFEGVFRNHIVYRSRNRDTAWFSITDDEWPAIDRALQAWLSPANHADGRQVRSLRSIRADG